MLNLFSMLSVGIYWVQVNLKEGINLAAYHIIVVSIIKNWNHCRLPGEIIAIMQDNRGEIGLVQKEDINEAD